MTTWVLLRGLARESRHWGGFVQTFAAQVPDARVITLDLPGNGSASGMRSPAAVADMAQVCREHLRRQGARPPFHLLAMSLGAMVAVAWAASHAEEITGCVLINTSLRPFSPFYRRLVPRKYAALLGLLLRPGKPESCESTILRLTTRHRPLPAGLLGDWSACSATGRRGGASVRCRAATRRASCSPRCATARRRSRPRCRC